MVPDKKLVYIDCLKKVINDQNDQKVLNEELASHLPRDGALSCCMLGTLTCREMISLGHEMSIVWGQKRLWENLQL